jgi:hypothetical protein
MVSAIMAMITKAVKFDRTEKRSLYPDMNDEDKTP